MYHDPAEPERVLGIWRKSMTAPGFWFRVVFTLTLYYWIYWMRTYIMLTNRRVTQYKPALIGGQETSVMIDNITDVRINTPPLGALLGFADVTIQTAGGDRAPEINFRSLERPSELKAAIFGMQDRVRGQMP